MASAKNVLHKTCSHLKSFQTNATGSLHHQPKPCSLTGKSLKLPYICMGNLMTPVLPEPASTDPRSALPFFFLPRSRLWVQPATRRPRLSAFECVPKSGYIKKGSKPLNIEHLHHQFTVRSVVRLVYTQKRWNCHWNIATLLILGAPAVATLALRRFWVRETSALDQLWWCWFWELDTYRDTVAIHLHCELTITIALSGGRKLPMKRESTSHRTAADRIMEIIGKQHIFGWAPTCCHRAFGNLHISLATIQR